MTKLKRVLLVDDDTTFSDLLSVDLRAGGLEVRTIGTAEALRSLLSKPDTQFDALLLDVGLPDADGRELCAELRQGGWTMPIIMLTGADAEHEVVRGLELGADDYVTKPCRSAELLARLRTQLRNHISSTHAEFTFGPYVFRPAVKTLQHRHGGRPVLLTVKEVSLLKVLLRAKGAVVRRENLLTEIWGYNNTINTHTLETHMYRLRQKVEEHPRQPQLLLGGDQGYRVGVQATAEVAMA